VIERNMDNDQAALCASLTIIVLGIFSFNLFVVLLGLFALVALNNEHDVWRTWMRVVSIFYYISLVVLIIMIFISFLLIIIGSIQVKGNLIGVGVYLLVISCFNIFYSRKTNYAISNLYIPLKLRESVKNDKTYGNESIPQSNP